MALSACSGETDETAGETTGPFTDAIVATADPAPASSDPQPLQEPLAVYLEDLAEGYSLSDPPSVEVIRHVRPDEQSALVAECMTERGWSVTLDPEDGGISVSVPNDQVPAVNESWYFCWGSYPPHEQYLRPMSEIELGRLYTYYADILTPCLRDQGYDVEPPSRDAWLEEAKAGDSYWVPYIAIAGPVPPDVAQQCPLSPDDDVIYSNN